MQFLVTGATGFVGGWIVERALAAGNQVRIIARDVEAAARLLPPDAELVLGQLTDAPLLGRALNHVDVLVHAAAAYQYGHGLGDRMRRETPEVARSVLNAARRAGTPHVIDISSAIVFAPHSAGPRTGVTDLESPQWSRADRRWGDPYLASKVVAYEATLRARSSGQPVTSVHPGMVFGPRDRGPGVSGSVLLSFIRNRIFPVGMIPWVDVRDVADLVVGVAAATPGGRYLLSRDWLPLRDLAQSVDRVTGRSRMRVFLPRPFVKLLASINDRSHGQLGPRLAPRASIEYLLGNAGTLDGSTGVAALGRPYRSVDETVHDTFEWWARNGMIAPLEAGAALHAAEPRTA